MTTVYDLMFYLCNLLLSFCLTYLYKKWALKNSILDLPNERSSHLVPTPRGGGIAIILTFYSSLIILFLTNQIESFLFYALLPGLVLAAVGMMDDIKGIGTISRFIIQFICAGSALMLLGGIQGIFGQKLMLLWTIIGLLGMIWYINLFNFLDGSDGYASMEAISILLSIWFFTRLKILLLLAVIVCGFYYWNWPKAKIFMGDVGSTTLGFILIVLGIYLHNNDSFHLSFWIILTALFWFDASFTLVHRIINRERLNHAHKNHIYQRAILGGYTHLQIMLFGICINIILFIICYLTWKNYIHFSFSLLITLIILWLAMKYIDHKYAFKINR